MRIIFYALKSFYKIWKKKWELEKRDVPRAREPERPFFSIDETNALIGVAKEQYEKDKTFINLRNLVMLLVSVDTGSRRIQLQRLDLESFTKNKTLNIPPAFKGGSWTDRKLHNDVIKYIEEYLVEREKYLGDDADNPKSPLFVDKTRKRISPEAMGWAFIQLKEKAGVEKEGGAYHGMRRSKTTRLYKGGMSEVEIVKTLGWKEGSKEPHIYIMLDQREVQDKAYKSDKLFDDEE